METHPLLDPKKFSRRHRTIWARRLKRPTPVATAEHWTPPRCPNQTCSAHRQPEGRWFQRRGDYWPLCRTRPSKRFFCKLCRRTFSVSAFRADRWDNKPWHNAEVLAQLTSGLGLRETARRLGMSRTALQMKARKIGLHCHHLHRNLLKQAQCGPTFMMDEMITFEGDRRLRPLSLAVLIDKGSYLIVDAFAAPRAPHGNRTERTKQRIEQMEAREGPRKDRHKTAVAKVMRTMVWHLQPRRPRFFHLVTDEEPTYRGIFDRVRRALPKTMGFHVPYKGDAAPRDPENPLFRINVSQAILRDRLGRLRRRSWLNSKSRKWLNRMISMNICVRNYVRPIRNDASYTPGEGVEIPDGRLSYQQVVGWRQDWGVELSLRPTAVVR
jgi:hypothetical protein